MEMIEFVKLRYEQLVLLFLLGIMSISKTGYSQNITNEGTDFWFGFTEMYDLAGATYEVHISSRAATSGTVDVPGTAFSTPFTTIPGTITTIVLPSADMTNTSNGIVTANKLVHIAANDPVSVLASTDNKYRTEASLVLPTSALGSKYLISTIQTDMTTWSFDGQFLIVASGGPCTVQITSPVTILDPLTSAIPICTAGIPFTISLNYGECYQLQTVNGGENLSGAIVEAISGTDKFAVYSGHNCALVEFSAAYDPLYEVEYPVYTWGTEHIVLPMENTPHSLYQVVFEQNSSDLYVNGVFMGSFDQGDFFQDTLSYVKVISGNNPIKVTQFMPSSGLTSGGSGPGDGDPSMTGILPNKQMLLDSVTFMQLDGYIDSGWVSVVTRTTDTTTVNLNGTTLTEWTPVAQLPFYSYTIKPTAVGSNNINTTGCGFLAYSYGMGDRESYYYTTGAVFNSIDDSIFFDNISTGSSTLCKDDMILLSCNVTGNILGYTWDFGDGDSSNLATPTHAYTSNGTYPVSLVIEYACTFDTILDSVNIVSCCIGDTTFTTYNTCVGDSIFLQGAFQTSSGTYVDTLTNTTGCDSLVNTVLIFEPSDTIGFTYTYPDPCDSTIVEFTASSTGQMDSIWWSMGFPGGSGLTDTIPTLNFPNAQTYNINLWIYGTCGWTDTTQQITTPSLPAYNYELMNHNKNYCSGDPVDTLFVVDTSGNGGIINWYDDTALMNNVGTGLHLIPQSSIGVYTYYITETLPCGERTLDSVNIEIINCVGCFGNLIPNPGFETYSTCYGSSIAGGFVTGPGNHMLHLATPWSNPAPAPDTANADYLNTCAEVLTDVPHTGNGYAGLVIFSQDCEYREYLQAPLNQSLLSGRCYQASMHIQVYTSSSANIDSVGMYFSAGAPVQGDPICPTGFGVPGQGLINVNPQITNDPTVDMTAYDWQLVTGTFIATGGEDYITIGNFAPDLNLNPQYFGPLPNRLAYYLVDDVCLYEIPPDTIDVNVTDTVTCSSVALTGPIGYDLYYWYDSTNTLASNTQFLNVTSLGTNTYVLYSLDTSMCPHTYYRDTLTVTINNIPSAGINDSVSYCSSGAAADLFTLLGGLPDTGGAWTPPMSSGTGIFDPATDGPGTYTYTIINSCGTDSADVVVTVHSVSSTTSVASICQGDSMFLGGSYQTTSGTYIDLFTVNGCDSTAETTLTVFPMADAAILSDSMFCENDPAIALQAASSGGLWSGTGITNQSVGTFDPGLAASGDHLVTYGIEGLCGDTVSATIRVNENPGITVSSADDSCLLANGSINLEITGGIVPYSYLWNNSSMEEDLTALSSGTYTVVVTDSMGCTRSETIVIQENLLNCSGNLWLPNIFSPNNDQLNDVLYVRGAETAQSFVFMIYNRWGEKVFETTEHTVGWDGTYRGEPLNSAVFAYMVTATFIDGTEAILNGTVTLVR